MSRLTYSAAVVLTIAGLATTSGCGLFGGGSRKLETRPSSDMKLSITPSATKVMVNETVTFEAHDENTLNRKAELKWETTGGKLWTMQDGRTAQVVFDKAGVYTVTGILSADGRVIEREARTVEVQPLAP